MRLVEDALAMLNAINSQGRIEYPAYSQLYDTISMINTEPIKHGHWVHGRELSRDYIGDVCVSIHYDKCWCSECYYSVDGLPLWKYALTAERKWMEWKMWKSPIEIKLNDFVSDVIEKEDEYIVKCVQQVGVNVDKYELVKALESQILGSPW